MENADVFGSSTAPLTWHDFLERMRQPSAADFVKSIKSVAVQEFLFNMEGAFRAHSLWAGCSEEELESAGEGLEKYVMTKLFTRVFASLPEDVKCDEQLSEKMALIQQFIRPENLDIKPTFQNETSWLLAQKELQKINMYKAPRDKLVCILNCCKVITNLLLNASIASNENPPGADEFLPVLIYVTIKANPPQLHSNLLYIQRYRRQSRLVSEAAYFFTNMLSAESFISNIDAKSISMDEAEFEKNMETAQALLSGLSTDLEGLSNQSNRDGGHVLRMESIEPKPQTLNSRKERNSSLPALRHHLSPRLSERKFENKEEMDVKDQLLVTKKLSIPDLEKKGATDLLKEDHLSRAFSEYRYLYAQVGDLTINDVEDLLNSYKQLVFKYVSLSKGLGVATSTSTESISQTQALTHAETKEDTREIEEENNRKNEVLNGSLLIGMDKSVSDLPLDETVTNQGMDEPNSDLPQNEIVTNQGIDEKPKSDETVTNQGGENDGSSQQ
ncbi:vacuolar protein sorting-associated protein 9A-like isoform X2 [Macadamia integrifolia]|uniref:vacuolar protein sorting-associated protein 9A-like isoform X2 n=1 Tax=Macadamia integrifolia TaxID=60698 RepID=UPI001C4FCC9B|nr:vacuolar protein sorting-associated protein 9A-like isoform X2 [Macadamia integrifolia]